MDGQKSCRKKILDDSVIKWDLWRSVKELRNKKRNRRQIIASFLPKDEKAPVHAVMKERLLVETVWVTGG